MRVVLFAAAGLALAGCSSTSSFDLFKTTPPQVTLQLDSTPPGADAVTSLGPGCKTPCSVEVPAADNFTVTFNLPRYQSETVPVNVVAQSGSPPVLDPNPATAELKLAGPAKRQPKKKPVRAARPPKGAPAAAPAEEETSPFPPPPR